MPAVLERLFKRAEAVAHKPDADADIPDVDPDSPELDDLFAWGDAVAKRGGITPERSREILHRVRENARRSR